MEIRDGDTDDFFFTDLISGGSLEVFEHNKYPDHTRHEVILRLAGRKEISPMVAVKMAVSFLDGWVNEDLNGSFDTLPFSLPDSKINPFI